MSDFVEECRREWRRLGVPDPLAEEMAADLASDLGEAEAEGVSVEEFLGSSVLDPRSFAATWAAERGVIPEPPGRGSDRRTPFALVAFTAVAVTAVIVAALLLATGEPKLSLVRSSTTPAGTTRSVVHSVSAASPIEWILLFVAIIALGFAAWLWSSWSRSRPPTAPA
ncbi:MAG TPA: hypothetical protein VMT74_11235 [Gaiellaceae bacterium]|nr:hypothetical protein [Gaiellaceae bacterium]